MNDLNIVILAACLASCVISILSLVAIIRAREGAVGGFDSKGFFQTLDKQFGTMNQQASIQIDALRDARDLIGKTVLNIDSLRNGITSSLEGNQRTVNEQIARLEGTTREQLGEVQKTVERQLEAIRSDNNKQLDRMRDTVDEKLASTLNDRLSASFKRVSDQLVTVSKGLGEMQAVALGVGDLKRVLSNVKNRGTLGEVQLGAILQEILSPNQYETDVATVPGSRQRVEYAVRIPVEGNRPVLLPIDSKCPLDTYGKLLDALDDGDGERIKKARESLRRTIKSEANDISKKYLSVPDTTNFGIMFLPFEGLYSEVVNMRGLVEELQRDFHVNVAGPSTMAAILNSLQLSYQTFALQKRSDEIQKTLISLKEEFGKYQKVLERALRQIETARGTVNGLIQNNTKRMNMKLEAVSASGAVDDDENVTKAESDDKDETPVEAEKVEEGEVMLGKVPGTGDKTSGKSGGEELIG